MNHQTNLEFLVRFFPDWLLQFNRWIKIKSYTQRVFIKGEDMYHVINEEFLLQVFVGSYVQQIIFYAIFERIGILKDAICLLLSALSVSMLPSNETLGQ